MAEWHLPPDYIVNNWTDELLDLMIRKLEKRKEAEQRSVPPEYREQKVSDADLFRQMGKNVKVNKHGD